MNALNMHAKVNLNGIGKRVLKLKWENENENQNEFGPFLPRNEAEGGKRCEIKTSLLWANLNEHFCHI